MQIGAVLPHHEIGVDPGAMKAYAQGVENLGLTHILLYDHVVGADRNRPGGFEGPYDKDVMFHEPLTTFAFIAAITERVEMVTNVMILPQRQTVLVAKQAAEVALLSRGRLRLGVGTGWNKVEYDALGIPFSDRGRRQEEQVELLRKLWTDDVLDFQGQFERVELAGINPRPEKTVPIWFGGGADVALDRAGRMGDGWMPLGGPGGSSQAMIDKIKSARTAAGLDWHGFGIQAQAMFAKGDVEKWRTHASKWQALGASHLALRTDSAELDGVDAHLAALSEYLSALEGLG